MRVASNEKEVIGDVCIKGGTDDIDCSKWIIELHPTLGEKYSVAMASTLVNARKCSTLRVRLMNPFQHPITLQRSTNVGVTSPVDDIHQVCDKEDSNECNNLAAVRQIKMALSRVKCHAEHTS